MVTIDSSIDEARFYGLPRFVFAFLSAIARISKYDVIVMDYDMLVWVGSSLGVIRPDWVLYTVFLSLWLRASSAKR